MNANGFDRRVRIEAQTAGIDPEYGTAKAQWVPVCEVWAKITETLPSKGEATTAGMEVAKSTAVLRMRFPPPFIQINANMRVIDETRGNREWKVASTPAEVGRKEAIEFNIESFSTPGGAA